MSDRKPTEERRREIADAAIKIIGDRGLREFTTAQLAKEVGIADGTIFRHFADKQEIVMAAVERLGEILRETMPPPTGDALSRLEEFFLQRVHMVATQPGIQSLLFSDQLVHAAGPEAAARLVAMRQRSRDYLRECLAEARGAGLLREGLDLDALIIILNGAVLSFVFFEKDRASPQPLETRATHVWRAILGIIGR